MISTDTLMLGKSLLTAGAVLGFCFWQLRSLRQMKRRDEQAEREDRTRPKVGTAEPKDRGLA